MAKTYTDPKTRAKIITHSFFKEGQNSWHTARKSAKIAIKLLIEDHIYAGNTLAADYWKQVKEELKTV